MQKPATTKPADGATDRMIRTGAKPDAAMAPIKPVSRPSTGPVTKG